MRGRMNSLSRLAISDDGFIFDPLTGNSFTTNRVGLWILDQLKQGKSFQEIRQKMLEEFDVEPEVAERDLTDFIEQLRTYKLI